MDYWVLFIYLIMISYGLLSICGATYDFSSSDLFAVGSRPFMQLIWIGTAFLMAGSIMLLDSAFIERIAPFFYCLMIFLLLVTIFVAPDIKGSRSWLVIGPLRLQPAEFAKVATALTLAWQINKYDFKLNNIKGHILLISIILLPIMLIILQKETGSALVFFVFFLSLYREGFSGIFLILALSLASYFIPTLILEDKIIFGKTEAIGFTLPLLIYVFSSIIFLIYSKKTLIFNTYCRFIVFLPIAIYALSFLINYFIEFDISYISYVLLGLQIFFFIYIYIRERLSRYLLMLMFSIASIGFYLSVNYVFNNIMQPHQQVRIKIALGIENDIRGKGYNVDQSKIAIGSGGLSGKGFLNGTQTKLSYVPEQATDFIFCTIGEEQGFAGTSFVILLYTALILRLLSLAERQTSVFARVYGYSVASIFLFHIFINIGMVVGLVPVIGIPLPFFSYGGSSMWGFTILLFIFLNLDARRKER